MRGCLGVIPGWVVGVGIYAGIVELFFGGAQPGDIHVGALFLGLFGAVAGALLAIKLLPKDGRKRPR